MARRLWAGVGRAVHGWRLLLAQALLVEAARRRDRPVRLTHRERTFLRFASLSHNGRTFMAPVDFLRSFTDQESLPARREISPQEMAALAHKTPCLEEGSQRMFRELGSNGLISFTEYLFLLSILTTPFAGLKVAFSMLDKDGDEKINKEEFLVLETVFTNAWNHKRKFSCPEEDNKLGLQCEKFVDTLLTIHFFGPEGKGQLTYQDFKKFAIDLQKEVLEVEFQEYSNGNSTISELDFASILLRYTDSSTNEAFRGRMKTRMKGSMKGITFEEYRAFYELLNNMGDFSAALKMQTLAYRPVSPEDMQRAVRACTGNSLSGHLLRTVFAIFDEDGDGLLDHKELMVMRERCRRRLRPRSTDRCQLFRRCIRLELAS